MGKMLFVFYVIFKKKKKATKTLFSCLLLTVKSRLICFQLSWLSDFHDYSTVLCIIKSEASCNTFSVSVSFYKVNSLNFWQIDCSFVSVTLIYKTDSKAGPSSAFSPLC